MEDNSITQLIVKLKTIGLNEEEMHELESFLTVSCIDRKFYEMAADQIIAKENTNRRT